MRAGPFNSLYLYREKEVVAVVATVTWWSLSYNSHRRGHHGHSRIVVASWVLGTRVARAADPMWACVLEPLPISTSDSSNGDAHNG